jgi:DNA-binding transcriptional regulator GbsR (MarR family)
MKKNKNPDRLRFSSLMESFASSEGMSPSSGKILGYLVMSDTPVPFSEISEKLNISRGGVSQNTRLLECHGIIERCRVEGDRRDHFRIRDDCSQALLENSRKRALKNISQLRNFKSDATLTDTQRTRIEDIEAFIGASIEDSHAIARTLNKKK